MINRIKKFAQGFSLVETLIAVLLLSTAIAGPLTIASKSLLSAVVAKNQIAAFFLAQDAVEFVRFARDTNCLKDVDAECPTWLASAVAGSPTDLTACLTQYGCYFDSTLPEPPPYINACSDFDCAPPLTGDDQYLYESGGKYSYDSGGARTPFVREVKITESLINPGKEALLIVTVHWRDGTRDRNVEVRESLFNWQ